MLGRPGQAGQRRPGFEPRARRVRPVDEMVGQRRDVDAEAPRAGRRARRGRPTGRSGRHNTSNRTGRGMAAFWQAVADRSEDGGRAYRWVTMETGLRDRTRTDRPGHGSATAGRGDHPRRWSWLPSRWPSRGMSPDDHPRRSVPTTVPAVAVAVATPAPRSRMPDPSPRLRTPCRPGHPAQPVTPRHADRRSKPSLRSASWPVTPGRGASGRPASGRGCSATSRGRTGRRWRPRSSTVAGPRRALARRGPVRRLSDRLRPADPRGRDHAARHRARSGDLGMVDRREAGHLARRVGRPGLAAGQRRHRLSRAARPGAHGRRVGTSSTSSPAIAASR